MLSTKLPMDIPNCARKILAIDVAATLAAVSLALDLSIEFLISSKLYFDIPTKSA